MKYFFILLLALSFPLKASSQLAMPIGGEQNKDWWIYSYKDDDTTSGSVRNFECSNYCYDGWSGIIFAIKNMKSMAQGVPILAAANGTVLNIHNGQVDSVNTTIISGGSHGNYIRIQHSPQLYTFYAFLRNNSIRVHDGQIVKKGDTIAMAGLSDNICFWPGLYFRVEDSVNGNFQDPMGDDCATPPYAPLLSTIPYYDLQFGLIDGGIINTPAITADTLIERPPTLTEISLASDSTVCAWIQVKNAYSNDLFETYWIDPFGNIAHDHKSPLLTSDLHFGYHSTWYTLSNFDTGMWSVEWLHNGDSVTTQYFHIVEQHSGVAQTNPIIQSIAFPQPSKDHATINGITTKEAHLYDIEGIEHPIRFEQIQNGTIFTWQDLPKGLHYLSIKDMNGQLHRAKIMVSP
jgi:hypothetical protein